MIEIHNRLVAAANNSPLLAGICMLVLNVGSRYIDVGFSKQQEKAIAKFLAREILIFAVCFMGTKDIVLSIILTGSFVVLSDHVFNESSPYCICPVYMADVKHKIDTDGDGKVSKKEIRAALDVLGKLKD